METDGAYRLIRACMTGLESADELLRAEPSLIRERTRLGETPLHYLAVENQLAAVRFLHERGASVEVSNMFGESALKEAILLGYRDLAEYLLTPLHVAVGTGVVDVVRALVDAGADVNAKALFDESPLHMAAADGAVDIARFLLECGADRTARDDRGVTPADEAATSGHAEVAALLSTRA